MHGFQLEPRLVHQILLTDPEDLNSLVGSSSNTQTLSFAEFRQQLIHNRSDPAFALKRAYHDNLVAVVQQQQQQQQNQVEIETIITPQPLQSLLWELHASIRALVPNRKDLHSLLQDTDIPATPMGMMPMIVKAARALAALESQARATTTLEWIHNGQQENDDALISFVTSSLFYLIDKAELCNQDKKKFYLTKVVAPRIQSQGEGHAMERTSFQKRFGNEQPPITQSWISSLLDNLPLTEKIALRDSPSKRRDLIRKGWIEHILFETQTQLKMPEIFYLDVETLQAIRNTTRLAAAGCALGHLACMAAKVNPPVLLQQEDKGQPLVMAMNHKFHDSVQKYEQSVEDCVVSLAKSWNETGNLDEVSDERLRGQTRSVLQGQSPIIKLLDGRMKSIFGELVLSENSSVPRQLTSGHSASHTKQESAFVTRARTQFQLRGLAFYCGPLAHAVELATKIANLSWDVYSQEFLDKMIENSIET
jgi:hypothetical protein